MATDEYPELVKALDKLEKNPGVVAYNLGTGRGYSVLEVIRGFERASGKKVAYRIAPRRPGDAASCYADPSRAERELHWKTDFDLDQMCIDSWNWQRKNPNGY